jgi:hypothetical protein
MWPLGFSRFDAIAWAIAVAVGVGVTAIGWSAGARLGAALAVGAIFMVAAIVVAMLWDARGASFRDGS